MFFASSDCRTGFGFTPTKQNTNLFIDNIEKADLKEFFASSDVHKEEFRPSHGEVYDQINRQVNEHTDGQINL